MVHTPWLCVFLFLSQVERCYYFLHACVETAQRKESVDGRLVQFLLSNPTNDGGQWDMLVNLIGQFSSVALVQLLQLNLHLSEESIYCQLISDKWYPCCSLPTKIGLNTWIEILQFLDAFKLLCVFQKNTASSLRNASPSLTAQRLPVEWTISSITRWGSKLCSTFESYSQSAVLYPLKLSCWHLPNEDLVAVYELVTPSWKHSLSHRMSRGECH